MIGMMVACCHSGSPVKKFVFPHKRQRFGQNSAINSAVRIPTRIALVGAGSNGCSVSGNE